MNKVKVYLALGSNLGNRLQLIESSIDLLGEKLSGIQVSKVYETEPWGVTDQPRFLNACVCGYTSLKPKALLDFVKNIEATLGRQKREKWGPREIDIDILFYAEQIVHEDGLDIPHPSLDQRNFVLVPLKDIAPDFVHPVIKKSIAELLQKLGDEKLSVNRGG